MDARGAVEPLAQVMVAAEQIPRPPPVFRTPRDDDDDGPVRFRIASVAPVDDQPTLFHIGSSEGLNKDNEHPKKVATHHRQSLGAWYQDSDPSSSEEDEENEQQQQNGKGRKHHIASTLKKHSLKEWFEGETPEQVLAYPKDEIQECARSVQELESQMSTALSSVIARLEQQEVQLKRHTKEFERLNEGDGVLCAVMKQLAKHDAWLTGDSVPPRNEISGRNADEILARCFEHESQLAQKIDRREVEERLKETEASVGLHSIEVSKLMDSVQDLLAGGAQVDMTIREMNQTQGHFKAMLDGLQSTMQRQDDDCRVLFKSMDALQRQVSGLDGLHRSSGAASELENLQTRISRQGQELARIAGKLDSIEDEIMPEIEPQPVIVREKPSHRRPMKTALKKETSLNEMTQKVELQVESVEASASLTAFHSPRQEELKDVKELSVFEQAASRPTADSSGDEAEDSPRSDKSETFNIYTMKRFTAKPDCWCLPVMAVAGSLIRDSTKVVSLKSAQPKKTVPQATFEKRGEHQRGSDMFEDARDHA